LKIGVLQLQGGGSYPPNFRVDRDVPTIISTRMNVCE